jgi:hypothetical protein
MDFSEKLLLLEQLKESKRLEYEDAFQRFSMKHQTDVTFGEVSALREELDELNSLISVVKKLSVV